MEITKIEKAFKSNELIKQDISKARARGLTPDQYYAENIAFYKEMVEGRNTSNMSVEEFLAPARARGVIEKRIGKQVIYSNVTPATANALDLVAGDLLRKLRDTGIMSREIEDIFNLKDVDGPIQTMVEQLIGVVRATKMARYAAGQTLKEFDLSSPSFRKQMFADVDKQVKVIAGKFEKAEGPVKGHNVEPIYFDVELKKDKEYCLSLINNYN